MATLFNVTEKLKLSPILVDATELLVIDAEVNATPGFPYMTSPFIRLQTNQKPCPLSIPSINIGLNRDSGNGLGLELF